MAQKRIHTNHESFETLETRRCWCTYTHTHIHARARVHTYREREGGTPHLDTPRLGIVTHIDDISYVFASPCRCHPRANRSNVSKAFLHQSFKETPRTSGEKKKGGKKRKRIKKRKKRKNKPQSSTNSRLSHSVFQKHRPFSSSNATAQSVLVSNVYRSKG